MKRLSIILAGVFIFLFSCQQEKRKNVKMPKVKASKNFNLSIKEVKKEGLQFDDIVLVLDKDEQQKINAIEMHENTVFTNKKSESEQQDFWKKMEKIAHELGFEPYWLYRVMIAESGINSAIQNRDTRATGLIQFMPSTATMLGTSIEELKSMSPQQQLDYVYKFYLPYKNKISCPIDLYIVTFYPYARGKSNQYVIGSEASVGSANLIARQNPNFDMDGNGYIELGEYRKYVRHKVFKEVPDHVFKTYGYTYEKRNKKPNEITQDTVKPKKTYQRYQKNGFNMTTRQ